MIEAARASAGQFLKNATWPAARKVNLIGLDVAHEPSRLRPRNFAPLFVAALCCALFLAALRVDLIRMRYATARAMAEEQQLVDRQSELVVQARQLRDPARVAERAKETGFGRPRRIIDLPASTTLQLESADSSLPSPDIRP